MSVESVTLPGGRTVTVERGDIRKFRNPKKVHELEQKTLPHPDRDPEAEFERVIRALQDLKAKRVFNGYMTTRWFLSPRGVSRRVRHAVHQPKRGKREDWFSWTIKTNCNGGHQATTFSKSKDEYEHESKSLPDAKLHLAVASALLNIPLQLPREHFLSVKKNRVAYEVPNQNGWKLGKKKGRQDPLEVSLDTYREVNGQKIEPVYLVEIQDTSPKLSAEVKEKRIRALAEELGLTIDPVIAPLSTEGLLWHLGVLRYQVA